MKLMYVSDGPRDEATLPGLVATILGGELPPHEFSEWARVRHPNREEMASRGYERKLQFAVQLASSKGCQGVVAVADRDRDSRGERKKALLSTKHKLTESGHQTHVAIGVADPHVDVWLLDDPKAVREALGFAPDHELNSVHKVKSPKDYLNNEISNSPLPVENISEPLRRIASYVQLSRCNHAATTGFQEFVDSCRRAFGST